jgi:hypothetical protein
LILPVAEAATPPDPHKQALALRRGAKIELTMANGDKLYGRLGEVATERFSFSTGKSPNPLVQEVAFLDVHSVKRAGMHKSTKILLVAGVVVVVALILVGVSVMTPRWN